MPAVGTWLLTAGKGLALWWGGAATWVKVLTLVGGNLVLSEVARRLATKDLPAGRDPQREVTVRSALAYQNIVYGRCAVGGVTVYHNAVPWGGNLNNHMFHVVTYAGHKVDGFEGFYADDRHLDFSVDSHDWDPSQPITGLNRGKVHTGEFRGNTAANPAVYVRYYLGDQSSADAIMVEEVTEWTTAHIGAGHAYGLWEIHQEPMGRDDFEQTSKIFEGGFPRKYMGIIRGKLLYDPRSDSPGPHRVDSDGTWEWSQNPALQVADYIRDTTLGMADSYSNIYWPAVHSVAEYCDGIVYTPSGTQARFTGNGVLNTGQSHAENLKALLSSFNGRLTWLSSGWYLSAGWEAPTKTINESMLAGPVRAIGALDQNDTYNHVRGWFYDKDEQYKQVAYGTATAAEYIARDNSEFLYKDVGLPMTTDWWEAQRVAFGILDQGDNQVGAEIPLDYSGFDLAVGKAVTLNFDVFSWSNKAFRMTDWSYQPGQGVTLQAREDFQASYTDPSTTDYVPRNLTTSLSSGNLLVPSIDPSSIAIEPEVDSIRLRWVNPSARAFEYVDVYWNQTNNLSDSNTEMASVRGNEFNHNIGRGNQLYYYWLRARDFAGNVSSFTPHTNSTGLIAQSRFPVQRDPSVVFLEEFDYYSINEYRKHWEWVDPSGTTQENTNAAITLANSGRLGRKIISVNCHRTYEVNYTRIPIEDDVLYRIDAEWRRTLSPSSGTVDIGVAGYDIDLNPLGYQQTSSFVTQYTLAHPMSSYPEDQWVKSVAFFASTRSWTSATPVNNNVFQIPQRAAWLADGTRYVSALFKLQGTGSPGHHQNIVEIDSLRISRVNNNDPLVYDNYVAFQKNWRESLADTTALAVDGLNLSAAGSQALLNVVNIAGEWNKVLLNPSTSPNDVQVVVERANTSHHRIIPGSIDVLWMGRTWICSGASEPNIAPIVVGYTSAGSPAGYFVGANITVNSKNYWESHNQVINVSVDSLIGDSGFSPPFFLSLGIRASMPSGASGNSNYLTELRGQFI